jgi:hypothetical protein
MPKTPAQPALCILSPETTGGSPPRDLGQHGRELWDAVQRESVKLWIPEAAAMAERLASCGIAMSMYGLNSCAKFPPPGTPGEIGAVCTEMGLDSADDSIQRRHRERVGRVGGKIGHAIDGAGGGRDLMAVLEDRVAGDHAVAGHARCIPG